MPPITLSITYDPAKIPQGFREADLIIRLWNGTSWVDLVTTVNTAQHTATAKISHFTIFALFTVPRAAPTPTPVVTPPKPTPSITPAPIPPVAPPPKLPWGLIIGIIVAVVIVAVVAYYFYTKMTT